MIRKIEGLDQILNDDMGKEATLVSGKFGEQEFQSDCAAELGVLRPIHLPHSTRTNFADDAIA